MKAKLAGKVTAMVLEENKKFVENKAELSTMWKKKEPAMLYKFKSNLPVIDEENEDDFMTKRIKDPEFVHKYDQEYSKAIQSGEFISKRQTNLFFKIINNPSLSFAKKTLVSKKMPSSIMPSPPTSSPVTPEQSPRGEI